MAALSEPEIDALAQAAYEQQRQAATIRPVQPAWASMSEEQKENWRGPLRTAASPPAAPTDDTSVRKVYMQADQPSDPVAPAVWIPLDQGGSPMAIDQWKVFV